MYSHAWLKKWMLGALFFSLPSFADWRAVRSPPLSAAFENRSVESGIFKVKIVGQPASFENGRQLPHLETYFYARSADEETTAVAQRFVSFLGERNILSSFFYSSQGQVIGVKTKSYLNSSHGSAQAVLEAFYEDYEKIEPYSLYTQMNDAIEELEVQVAVESGKVHVGAVPLRELSGAHQGRAGDRTRNEIFLLDFMYAQSVQESIPQADAQKVLTEEKYQVINREQDLPRGAGDDCCSICHTPFVNAFASPSEDGLPPLLAKMTCGHVFCLGCISEAYTYQQLCPNCRTQF